MCGERRRDVYCRFRYCVWACTRGVRGKRRQREYIVCEPRMRTHTQRHAQYTCYRSDIALLLNSNVKNEKTLLNGGLANVRDRPQIYSSLWRVIAKLDQTVSLVRAAKINKSIYTRIVIAIGKFSETGEREISLFSLHFSSSNLFALSRVLVYKKNARVDLARSRIL